MKEKGVLFAFVLLIFFFFFGCVSAVEVDLNYSADSKVQIRQLKYEPYPVNPGEYFDLWISAQYVGTSNDIVFELEPEYPFFLDSNEEAVKNYGRLISPSLVLSYKVRVDKDAVEGTNELKLKYKVGDSWYAQVFKIEVEDAQTSFDAIVQEFTGGEVSIAIANTGKQTANSVVVRIPSQDDFVVTGSGGQMAGNLDSGDYTILSFEVTRNPRSNSRETESILNLDVYYTDNIGERRVVNLELPLRDSGTTGNFSGDFSRMRNFQQSDSSSWWKSWYWWVIVVVAVIALYSVYKMYGDKIFKKKKSSNLPNWMNNLNVKGKGK